ESEGTYNLPEAQLDRFMFKLRVDYPSAEQESEILKMHSQQVDLNERLRKEVQAVTNPAQVLQVMQMCASVRVEDSLVDYINKIVRATRTWPAFHIGASPRAGLALMQSARTLAAFGGRDYAVPDDVVEIAIPAMRHRVQLTAESEIEGRTADEELSALIRGIEVPRD
ncbi:MAG: MoxR family ATPase, partial [Rubripirellula sp.]